MESTNYQRLKFLRKQAGLTQADMAKALGIKGSSYSLIESGRTKISDYHLQVIKDILKLDINYIVNGSSDIPAEIKTSNMIHIKVDDAINRRLKKLREDNGLIMKEVAEKTGIPINTLYRYEVDMQPNLNKMKALANLYGVSIQFILHGIEDGKKSKADLNEVSHWKEMMEKKIDNVYEQINILKDIILKNVANGNFPEGNRITDNVHILYYDKVA